MIEIEIKSKSKVSVNSDAELEPFDSISRALSFFLPRKMPAKKAAAAAGAAKVQNNPYRSRRMWCDSVGTGAFMAGSAAGPASLTLEDFRVLSSCGRHMRWGGAAGVAGGRALRDLGLEAEHAVRRLACRGSGPVQAAAEDCMGAVGRLLQHRAKPGSVVEWQHSLRTLWEMLGASAGLMMCCYVGSAAASDLSGRGLLDAG